MAPMFQSDCYKRTKKGAEDRVAAMDAAQRQRLNAAFVNSVGFSLAALLPVLAVLGRWVSANQGAS